jgi:hypothetical protein
MARLIANWDLVLSQLDHLSHIRVFLTIVSLTDDKLIWYSNTETRGRISWRWQMAPSTVKYAIAQLVKKGFLVSLSRGVYKVDKKYLNNIP